MESEMGVLLMGMFVGVLAVTSQPGSWALPPSGSLLGSPCRLSQWLLGMPMAVEQSDPGHV
eukprot:2499146-Alexandrium_andersonii.AAC.1